MVDPLGAVAGAEEEGAQLCVVAGVGVVGIGEVTAEFEGDEAVQADPQLPGEESGR